MRCWNFVCRLTTEDIAHISMFILVHSVMATVLLHIECYGNSVACIQRVMATVLLHTECYGNSVAAYRVLWQQCCCIQSVMATVLLHTECYGNSVAAYRVNNYGHRQALSDYYTYYHCR